MSQQFIDSYPDKETCDQNYSSCSISEIHQEQSIFTEGIVKAVGNPTRTINKCFEEIQRQERMKVKQKIQNFERMQELMKHKLQNYLKILQKEISKKEEGNRELRQQIVQLQNQIFQCGGDIAVLSKISDERRIANEARGLQSLQCDVLRNAQNRMNGEHKSKSKSSGKLKSMKKKKENEKKSPCRRMNSTSGKKKKCSPPPRQKQLKKLIF